MKPKILFSVAIMALAGAAAIGGTVAYFSDTEASTGNIFTAGKLDLQVDSTCHYDGMVCTIPASGGTATWVEEKPGSSTYPELKNQNCYCTWMPKDLVKGTDIFFNFADVKPGDIGENTVSLHIDNNPGWVCADISSLTATAGACNGPKCIAENGTWDGTQCTFARQIYRKICFSLFGETGIAIMQLTPVAPGQIQDVQRKLAKPKRLARQ